MLWSLAAVSAGALDLSSLAPFLYGDSSYVPLKSTAGFLGAPLRWDADTGQAIISYKGQDLALTPNKTRAYYAGQAVELSSPPVVINGVTYVPLEAFRKYYKVPATWDRTRSEMKIKGSNGWRTMKVSSRSPWHGGPPPWAPAWGQRGYGTPGYSSNGNANGKGKGPAWKQRSHPSNRDANRNGKTKAWKQRGDGAPSHMSNRDANENGKGPALKQRGHGTLSHPNNRNANGKGKTSGHKKDR